MSMALRLLIPLIAIVACIKAFQQPAGLATQMTIGASNAKSRAIIQYGILSNGDLGYLVFAIAKDRADTLEAPVRQSTDQAELLLPNGDRTRLPAVNKVFEIKGGIVNRCQTVFPPQDVLDYLESRPEDDSIEGLFRFVQGNDR